MSPHSGQPMESTDRTPRLADRVLSIDGRVLGSVRDVDASCFRFDFDGGIACLDFAAIFQRAPGRVTLIYEEMGVRRHRREDGA